MQVTYACENVYKRKNVVDTIIDNETWITLRLDTIGYIIIRLIFIYAPIF